MQRPCGSVLVLAFWSAACAWALNPQKAITQYSRTTWTQQDGLPQDTIRAITQTPDGYLWLGTDDGLVRFDGYEFVSFLANRDGLPSNSVTALTSGQDGSLWIGTLGGLARYQSGRFRTYGIPDGLPDESVRSLFADRTGAIWIAAGGNLSRFSGEHFTNFKREEELPLHLVRAITEDFHSVYAAGNNAVLRFEDGRFVPAFNLPAGFEPPLGIRADSGGNVWVVSSHGLAMHQSSGGMRQFSSKTLEIQTVLGDHDGNLWVGTLAGLVRLDPVKGKLDGEPTANDAGSVICLFEDREGNLWAGGNNGLTRFRDDVLTVYGKKEGLPSDAPNALYQSRSGLIWTGFLDHGLASWDRNHESLGVRRAILEGRIYSIREAANGDLLVGGREGFVRVRGEHAERIELPDPLHRKRVFDAMEGPGGRVWLAMPEGLGEWKDSKFRVLIPAGPLLQEDAFVTLAPDEGETLWAGTIRKGLWHFGPQGAKLYTMREGLPSDQIRALYREQDGTLWIGTLGGGLSRFAQGKFTNYSSRLGLLNDNVSEIVDDGESLWLGTARGICRVFKQSLDDFAEGRISALKPINYGVADGLSSAQSSPEIGAKAFRHADGSLWFATARGIAVFEPRPIAQHVGAPPVSILEMKSEDHSFGSQTGARVAAGTGRVEIRYGAIHLRAPERLDYAYKLEGLDSDWVPAGRRRVADYNSLSPGHYKFRVRAQLASAPTGEASYEFDLLPHVYQTNWFRVCSAALVSLGIWFVYKNRERQMRLRYAAVVEERARLARELHDTLAQGFVGIASQLDAAVMFLPAGSTQAKSYVEIARRMARHSLTEARRSVQDLRASALDDQDLAQALESGLDQWVAGTGVEAEVAVEGNTGVLPENVAHQILRIAQEAVANAVKHAQPHRLKLRLEVELAQLRLCVHDDGCGLERPEELLSTRGHFGLIGMRERAKRLGGTFQISSQPGGGTQIDVTVPLG